MDKLNLLNRKIQNMKTLRKNISKIIKEEYRKRYFYSANYYYISKINPLFSDTKNNSKIKYKFKEIQYECDEKDYIIPIFYKPFIIRFLIKTIILNNPINNFLNNFPSYVCYEKEYFNIFHNHIKNKITAFKNIYSFKDKQNIDNKIFDKDNKIYKENNSIIHLINDENYKEESEDKYNNNDNEEKEKENNSVKSLILLVKKMSENNYEQKYNKIKKLFLENTNIEYNNFSNKYNNFNIYSFNNKKKLSTRKRTSLPEFPLVNYKKRILHSKTDKNLLKYLAFQTQKLKEEKIKIGKGKNKNNKTFNSKKFDDKKNKKFIPISFFKNEINKKKKIIQNLWNKCNVYEKYENNEKKNEVIINDNKINFINVEDEYKIIRKHFSKKCNNELNYDKLDFYGVISNNKKSIKNSMINQILKLTSRNSFNLKNFKNNNQMKNELSTVDKIYNERRGLIKSLSYRNNKKYILKDKYKYNLKKNNKKDLKE